MPDYIDPHATPPQLSREDLANLTNDQINAARKMGQLDQIMGRRPAATEEDK